jgi:drug/metabolite transporter, DME family
MQKEYFLVIIAAILFGLITVGAQFFTNLGLSLYEISVFAFIFETMILLPFLIKKKYQIKKKMILFFIVYGLIGGVMQLSQYGGVVLGVPVAIVALLLYSQPIWTTILGKIILKEKITKIKIIASLLSFIGVIILIKPWDINSVGPISGILISLIGGISLSLWVIWGRKSGINGQHYITTSFGYAFFSLIFLLLYYPLILIISKDPSIIRLDLSLILDYWFYFLIFALLTGVIAHSLFYKGAKKIEASISGIILLVEPISATILAAIFFLQYLTLNILIGGFLILVSNYLIIKKS